MREETAKDSPSVIIARRPCVLLSREKTVPVKVNRVACVNCGVCMKLGCPALVQGEAGPEADASLCKGCALCAGVCPKKAIEKP